jgi:sugar lactone lactonase YvrE
MPIRSVTVTAAAMLLAGGIVCGSGYAETVPFDSNRWVFVRADTTRVEGQLSLSGSAYLDGVEFENGVIEADVMVTGARSYPGITFRVQSPANLERVYIRPHRAGFYPDAIQYTPTINGMECWQLYNGDGYTAAADLPADEWVHFKIEVKGVQARVFLGGMTAPALEINDLKHGDSHGTIGLEGPPNATARFANFSYRQDDALEFDAVPTSDPPPGLITDWDVSQAFPASEIEFGEPLSAQSHDPVAWRPATCEASGLVNIAWFVEPIRGEPNCVWARTTIPSDDGAPMKLNFGYSDYVWIFLNDKLLFEGNSAYRQRDPSFLGIIGFFDAVTLPLQSGENALVLLVGESFGGWGFMCQDGDAVFQHESLVAAWETPRTFKYPESVVYDAQHDVLYVSNYAMGGPGFISKVGLDGRVMDLQWVKGLNRPSGLCMRDGRLLAVERNAVAEIDPEDGEIVQRYPIPGARFPNDIAVSPTGDVFISESATGAIIRGALDGGLDVWLQDPRLAQPNGICLTRDRVLVGCSGDGTVKAIDLADRTMTTVARLGRGSVMDGLAVSGGNQYLVGDNNGRIFAVGQDGQKTQLLNTSVIGMTCADFTYVAEKNLIVIPTWLDHRVVAYKYSP